MRYFMLVSILVLSAKSFACDICGGVSSNASIGLFASTKFHTIGFKSSFRSFSSYMYGVRHSQEYLFGQEFQFRTQLHSRIQLLGSLPYQNAIQKRDFGNDFISGIGDPSIIGNFVLYQKKDSAGISKDFLTAGIGVKFPFGNSTTNTNTIKNLYPGTGSLDYIFISNYTKQFSNSWGWQTELSYSYKGINKYGYQYGNSFLLSSQAFKSWKVNAYRFIVATGLIHENYKASKVNGEVNNDATNAGYVLSFKTSLNLLTYRWLWSIYLQQPISQNINKSMIHQNFSGGISLNYLIKNSKK